MTFLKTFLLFISITIGAYSTDYFCVKKIHQLSGIEIQNHQIRHDISISHKRTKFFYQEIDQVMDHLSDRSSVFFYEPSRRFLPKLKNKEDIPQFYDTYLTLLRIINNPYLITEQILYLKYEVQVTKSIKNIRSIQALDEVLTSWENTFGFNDDLVILNDMIDPNDFRSILYSGRMFIDEYFNNSNFFADDIFQMDIHGALTHRIQWHILFRIYNDNPLMFPDIEGPQDFVSFYKSFGDENVRNLFHWKNKKKELWSFLFDNLNETNFSQAEYLNLILREVFNIDYLY